MTKQMNISEDLPYSEQFLKYESPELFIMTNYIQRKGRELNCSVSEYWRIMKNYFIPLKTTILDAYWSFKKGRENWREDNLMNCTYTRPIYWSPKLINQYFDFIFWRTLLESPEIVDSNKFENILLNDGSLI